MKKKTLFKKLVSSVMVSIIALGQFSGFKFISKAAPIIGEDGPIYIALSKTNENGNGYAFGMDTDGSKGESIWSMVVSTDQNKKDATNASNIYCIKAQYGESWEINPELLVKYNKNYEVPLKQNSEQQVANKVLLGEHKNEILWLIDNMYIPGESNQEDLTKYLNNAGIYYDEYDEGYLYVPSEEHDYSRFGTDVYPETVEEEDLVAIQQAAIWYYTNYGENDNIYSKEGIANWLQYTNETILNDITAQNKYPQLSSISEGRNAHATIIYNRLINQAKKVAETLGDNEYELKNTTAKLWISLSNDGKANEEQPVIEIHKKAEEPKRKFDLALRKFITQIQNHENTQEVTTRIPQVSYNTENKKIVYTHPKDAIVVHVGDTIIYTLRVYNEGDIDGYASEVKDDIPEYLEYLPQHEINTENEWEMYDAEGNKTENVEEAVCIRTEHLAKGKGLELETENANLIKAFDSDKQISEINPHYKELKVAFKAKDPNSTEYEIINFAQIFEDTDSEGNPVKDIDSKPNNGEDEPEEDDEDIEKVKVKVETIPEEPEKIFDLSLRKAIVSVNGSTEIKNASGEVATRPLNQDGSIQIVDTSVLENDTTADYKHRKDPIVVKKGDTVKYAITIYNEGEEAGYATKIVDQLPGTANIVRLDNKNYGEVTSSIGNIYKVEYTASTNTVTLAMTEKSPKNVLEPYDKASGTLASETILLDCIVEGKADSKNNKILTNIACIAEEYNAYKNVTISNGEEIQDRDSQTWNSPNEIANNLVTTDIGYTGGRKHTDLSKNDIHYKGMQDDDDFEKLVILPEIFDLSLRKDITKVDGQELINSREPNEVITSLDNETKTTAEYNHRKDPVVVENGSLVDYKISLYNEGSINGIATIVKDQLPTGLKLNFDYFTKEGEEHFAISSK
jgi:uncharacterized repeat protein (TIGR01451 family)